jgi:hypothetical protein
MTIAGTVRNGVVVLDDAPPLAEGTRVEVVVPAEAGPPTLRNLLKVAGIIEGMPSDFADQHDHYIHGTPRK